MNRSQNRLMNQAQSKTKPVSESIYIGTMSGTSMDGLDLVAIRFPENTVPETCATQFTPYPEPLKQKLQQLALDSNATINKMCLLDSELGQYYAQQINEFIATQGLSRKDIAAVGSHGQTVRHLIQGNHPYTLQIGDPNIIAAKTGLSVVADFRRRDIALNGQGAPLAPAFHNQVFRNTQVNRAIINIGGIANITCLPAETNREVIGFDSGPGNTLMDHLCQLKFDLPYDEDGKIASIGKINPEQLSQLIKNEPYFKRPFPKSTGTDYFSPKWLASSGLLKLSAEDCMANLAGLTAITIAQAIQSLDISIDEFYLCGGGAKNKHLTQVLSQQLSTREIHTTERLGIHPDWVEASAFAWLASQTLLHKPGNLPSVTNAEKFTILGAVYF
jgi:anhydro-N-acetylmuramic acid kinase